ncbi:MAG: type II toxin-antitoxin system RelE/ParE family toxin [Nitrospirae bacterium]|nr:type II toxin-antitoxin system RelE/ParE family toxin [Nitrospirota bacterium]
MTFEIRLAKEAQSDLEELHVADRRLFSRILARIESLADNPFHGKPLVGNHSGEYSLRVGDYRIIYEVDKTSHAVHILTAKHRKHVY